MICSQCGGSAPDSARFCPHCGTSLEAACAACGTSLVAGARFCAQCGTPVAASATGPGAARPAAADGDPERLAGVAERKVVSVLFADLVGFTTLAEGRDHEAVRELLSRYFDQCQEIIG
ncbi:MAG TPA: zinc-ribbon domain-containing protein, partial [Candidatus Limnocylindrales bacterium]|nr:zinc-ribbon domain-containing protein [Candidatus Limnocylindrales bacterium]